MFAECVLFKEVRHSRAVSWTAASRVTTFNMRPMDNRDDLKNQRDDTLEQLHDWIDAPMVVLGFVWLALVVGDLVTGLPRGLTVLSTVIWVIFILEFLLEFALAPDKLHYLRRNWLAVLSLLLPGFRVFRVLRFLRVVRFASATRGLRLLTIMTSVNRGMKALRSTMRRRGLGYVVALTLLVTFTGAAGMYAFEKGSVEAFDDYWSALWWTAMIMTTMGSQYWPHTPAGQVLCLFLAVYAFAVFGYVTGTLASFFVGREAEHPDSQIASASSIDALRSEIAALREEIARKDGDKGT